MESRASSVTRGTGRQSEKGRRVWSPREEAVLVNSMKDSIADGWKTDNGFRAGYLGKLETAMKKVFPGTDLKGQPHINSKIVGWKRHYAIVSGALGLTGVGFNDESGTIECTDEQWAVIVQNDPDAKGKRDVPFPLYKTWVEIFGKDRATGEASEDVMDAINDLINEEMHATENASENRGKEKVGQSGTKNDCNVSMGGLYEEEGNSVCQSDKAAAKLKLSGQKRKHSEGLEGLYELVGQICRTSEAKLDRLAEVFGYEHDLGEKRKNLFELVGRVTGLSTEEKLDASIILAKCSNLLEMFLGVPDEAKCLFIQRLLTKQAKP